MPGNQAERVTIEAVLHFPSIGGLWPCLAPGVALLLVGGRGPGHGPPTNRTPPAQGPPHSRSPGRGPSRTV